MKKESPSCSSILKKKEIVVQPFAAETTGKAQKYERMGPQEFVPLHMMKLQCKTVKKLATNMSRSVQS